MNRFRLPYHLKIEEGILNDVPGCMKDVFPELKKSKIMIVTTEHLMGLFPVIVQELQKDFPENELYLSTGTTYDSAVALAKQIVVNDIKLVIGLGGGSVLDLAKYAAFVSKTKLISLPTALSNDSLASPELYTTGYYIYVKASGARKINFPQISALGLMLTAIIAPVTYIVRKLLNRINPVE